MKKAIRIISFSKSKYAHTPPLFKEKKILPFYEQMKLKRASYMWKVHYGYTDTSINNLFLANAHNTLRYVLPQPLTEKDKLQPNYNCVKTWNTVPEHIRKITIFKSFKTKYHDIKYQI